MLHAYENTVDFDHLKREETGFSKLNERWFVQEVLLIGLMARAHVYYHLARYLKRLISLTWWSCVKHHQKCIASLLEVYELLIWGDLP